MGRKRDAGSPPTASNSRLVANAKWPHAQPSLGWLPHPARSAGGEVPATALEGGRRSLGGWPQSAGYFGRQARDDARAWATQVTRTLIIERGVRGRGRRSRCVSGRTGARAWLAALRVSWLRRWSENTPSRYSPRSQVRSSRQNPPPSPPRLMRIVRRSQASLGHGAVHSALCAQLRLVRGRVSLSSRT